MRGNQGTSSASFPISRKEYIGDVAGSVAFATTQYSLNPGLIATFPWCGQIAPNFEEYDTLQIELCYEPESASTATGTVIISFDYDALDAAPTTKQQALEFADSVRVAPWAPASLVLKTQDLRKRGRLYTRSGAVPSGADAKTYDLGNVFVSTQGQASTANVGEFWIRYRFLLATPQLNSGIALALSAKVTGSGSVTKTSVFGTAATISGGIAVTASGNTLTFSAPGQYLATFYEAGTGIATGGADAFSGTATVVAGTQLVNAASTAGEGNYTINVTAGGQTVVMTSLSTTVTAYSVSLSTYASSLGPQ